MEINFKKIDDKWTVITISGRIDANTSAQVESTCRTQLDEGAVNLAIGLSDVSYMSSAGLRVLLATLKLIQAKSGKMALINPRKNVREVLDISGFSSIFTIVDDVGELS